MPAARRSSRKATASSNANPISRNGRKSAKQDKDIKSEAEEENGDVKVETSEDVVMHDENDEKGDHQAQEHDFIPREFYPPELSDVRAEEYQNGTRIRPIAALESALSTTESERSKIKAGDAVIHWFRTDLRVNDNSALRKASEVAKEAGVPVLALYVWSHQDLEAHCRSPARVDFYRRELEVLRKDLQEYDIPLYVLEVEKRKTVEQKVLNLCEEWEACRIYGNLEYEVDELRRDTKMIKEGLKRKIAAEFLHDDCVIAPGKIVAKSSAKPFAVFSPFLRRWLDIAYDPENWKLSPAPHKNPSNTRKLFPDLFKDKQLPKPRGAQAFSDHKDRDRVAKLWPAGEQEAMRRLSKFVKERIMGYKDHRDLPGEEGSTSKLGHHLSSGSISARQVVKAAAEANHKGKVDGGELGPNTYISELAWRDFYRHIICHWPHVSMNKPFKVEYSHVRWEYDDDLFQKWCEGKTGFPIVDAAMRQLNHMKWMHNRCRMIVASFIAKDLLLDWRKGERYFMENLIDGDLASNNGGWQWSAGCGVDPQPYFRIFNPLLQSEKFDADGDYIRHWVPELKGVKGKAIHDPYGRLDKKEFEKLGYPKPCVDHKQARDRALDRYKKGLGNI